MAHSNMLAPGSRVAAKLRTTSASTQIPAPTQTAASPPVDRRGGHTNTCGDRDTRLPVLATYGSRLDRRSAVHVALNALLFSREQSYRSGGISRVISHLLGEFARDTRGHQFDVFVPSAPWSSNGVRFHAAGNALRRPTLRIAWEQTLLSRRLAALQPDLFHGLAYALPIGWGGPALVTMYDLSFLRYPAAFKPANRIYLAAASRAAARRARLVLTISEHARRDIVRLLNVPEQRVEVTYPAAEERYRV